MKDEKYYDVLKMIAGGFILLIPICVMGIIWSDSILWIKLSATCMVLAFLFGIAGEVAEKTENKPKP